MSMSRLFCTAVLLAACAEPARDVTGVGDAPARLASANAAKGVGAAVYAYTLAGDISTTPESAPSTAKAQVSNPFLNLSTSPATLTLGTPTGDSVACRAGSNAEYVPTFGNVAGRSWVGTLRITNTGTLIFLGTEFHGTETLQFTLSDLTDGPVLLTNPSGPATYSYTNAALYFGSGGVGYDGKYRCVNFTVTATPHS